MSRYFYHKLDFARALVEILPPHQWSVAYPGNSPDIAQEGVDVLDAGDRSQGDAVRELVLRF